MRAQFVLALLAALAAALAPVASAVPDVESVHDFEVGIRFSGSGLVLAGDGFFYGVSSHGNSGPGAIYKISPAGEAVTLARFTGTAGALPGSRPVGPLTLANDGNMYSVTAAGGDRNLGTVFKVVPGGVVTSIATFTGANGATPVGQQVGGALVQGQDGALYGATNAGGSADVGTIFKVLPNGALVTVAEFTGNDGALPGAQPRVPFVAADGKLYGTTRVGGASGAGAIYCIGSGSVVTSLASFTGNAGGLPGSNANAGFVETPQGLYGTTINGGAGNAGTIFRINPTGVVSSVGVFTGTGGALPGNGPRAPMLGPDGAVYGTTASGGPTNHGTVFRVPAGGTAAVSLASFTGTAGALPGEAPVAGMASGADGNLYGVTNAGGASGAGTVFTVVPGTGAVSSIVAFSGTGGALPGRSPLGNFVRGSDQALYSSTSTGGATLAAGGTIFRIGTDGVVSTQGTFTSSVGATLGQGPSAAMTTGPDGALYGTTLAGGRSAYGAFYKVPSGGGLVTLTSFSGEVGSVPSVGSQPRALIAGPDGFLYGVNFSGGTAGCGTVFRKQPSGDLVVLASFTGRDGALPGQNPVSLTRGDDGKLYGVTVNGGAGEFGTVFRIVPAEGSVQHLVSFTGTGGALPGTNPSHPLTRASDGNLYGVTQSGGPSAQTQGGTVFRVVPDGGVTYLMTLSSLSASSPAGPLVGASDGNLYGCTVFGGGAANSGVLFRVVPSGAVSTVAAFTGASGQFPGNGAKSLTATPNGFLFGSSNGGVTGFGTIFRVDLSNPGESPTSVATFTGTAGALPGSAPSTPMTLASDGSLYGITSSGGANNGGVIYQVAPGGVSTVAHLPAGSGSASFPGSPSQFIVAPDGSLYAAVPGGGAGGAGGIVAVTPGEGSLTTIASFTGVENPLPGRGPNSPLVVGPDGNLYGTTAEAGFGGGGTIYRISFGPGPAAAPTILSTSAVPQTATTAMLTALVTPNGADTTVRFEFGPDGEFSSLTAPVVIAGTAGTTQVTASVSDLAPHTRYRFRATASNAAGATVSAESSFVSSNRVPVPANDTIHPPGWFGAFTVDVLGNDVDPDGDVLTLASVSKGARGNVTIDGTSLIYTPTAGSYDGNDLFTYTVSDGFGGLAEATVTLVNAAPVANAQALDVLEDSQLAIALTASDADGDAITFIPKAPLHGTLAGGAPNLIYTPAANYFGLDSFTFTVNDNHGRIAEATITIDVAPVNDPPVAIAEQFHNPLPGPFTLNVLANDSDIDSSTLTISAVRQGSHGSVATDGARVTYLPGASYDGNDTFTYVISDGAGGTAEGTVVLRNAQPIAASPNLTATEDAPREIALVGFDADGDSLSYTILSGPARGTLTGTGASLVYNPAPDATGVDAFTFRVSDAYGGSAQAIFTINVLPVNDAPVAVADNLHAPAVTGAFEISVLANDHDVDIDAVLAITSVDGSSHGTVEVSGSTVLYTPSLSYTGNDSFTYTMTDGAGGSATATVTLTNERPLARPDFLHPPAGPGPHTIEVLSNDLDADPEDVLIVAEAGGGSTGTLKVSADSRAVLYTPGPGYNGNDTFTYTVTDSRGGSATSSVTLSNEGPVPTDDSLHAPKGAESFEVAVLGNDSDGDADPLSISGASQGAKGTVSIVGAALLYTPTEGYDGNDTFTYTITDGRGAVATATVRIRNTLPVAGADTATAAREPVEIQVLANDSDGDGDGPLRVIAVSAPLRGNATTNGATITYTPGPGFRSGDSFTYTVSDGHAGTAVGKVAIFLADVLKDGGTLAQGAQVPGELAGTVFKKFGIPSINDGGNLAFLASTTAPGYNAPVSGIFAGSPLRRIAREGSQAPGNDAGVFASFRDPVLNDSDEVAFLASLSGGAKGADEGLFVGKAAGGDALTLVARKADDAPGVVGGKFAAFRSIALADNGRLVFVATMLHGSGGVSARNDLGVWGYTGGGLSLILREGQELDIAGSSYGIKTLALLNAVSGSPGQRRSFNAVGDLLIRVSFIQGGDAVVFAAADGELEVVAMSGDALDVMGDSSLQSTGIGALDNAGRAVFKARLQRANGGSRSANEDIILQSTADDVLLRKIARTNDGAPGVAGGVFKRIGDPLSSPTGEVAFAGTLQRGVGGVTAADDSAVWQERAGILKLAAREGEKAPGAGGGRFQAFRSLALPSSRGIAFVATLARHKGLVTSADDVGFWASDRDGAMRLLIREGETVEVAGQMKQLQSFTILGAVTGSAGQGHSSSANGGFVYRATFTDRSQAIQTVWIP